MNPCQVCTLAPYGYAQWFRPIGLDLCGLDLCDWCRPALIRVLVIITVTLRGALWCVTWYSP